jgi:hypothetical protein
VADDGPVRHRVVRIDVRLKMGGDLRAGTDDPVFLGLRGLAGREFRLAPARGRSLRRGREEHLVLADAEGGEASVDHADLNDPTQPPLEAEHITGVYLRKGLAPIPNVRGLGEMDDRLQVEAVSVEIAAEGKPLRRYSRAGPFWLGLVCGLQLEIPPAESGA